MKDDETMQGHALKQINLPIGLIWKCVQLVNNTDWDITMLSKYGFLFLCAIELNCKKNQHIVALLSFQWNELGHCSLFLLYPT